MLLRCWCLCAYYQRKVFILFNQLVDSGMLLELSLLSVGLLLLLRMMLDRICLGYAYTIDLGVRDKKCWSYCTKKTCDFFFEYITLLIGINEEWLDGVC